MVEHVEDGEKPQQTEVEAVVHEAAKSRRKLRVKTSDIIIFAVLLVIIGVLTMTLIGRLQLKHDVANARVVTDKVIADVANRDGGAIWNLGSSKFKSTYTAQKLTDQVKAVELVTGGKATVDREIMSHGTKGNTVLIVYKYPPKLANQPYYLQVAVSPDKSGKWQVVNLSGSADKSYLANQ